MRVLLSVGEEGWSYDFTARALVEHLSDRFTFEIAYRPVHVHARAQYVDLVVDFWWRGGLEHHYGKRVLKQVSSHRWQQDKFGALSPEDLARTCLSPSAGVVVPSVRLASITSEALAAVGSSIPVTIGPKGFDPALFSHEERSGALRIGWAGTGRQLDKRLDVLRAACPELLEAGPSTRGVELPYEQMPSFYRSLDVITCASQAEGDPRPLIEAMACGCFPVTVDVGIVPELVVSGENGLIVERTPEAFAEAFAWCRANLDYVRARGRENAERMLATRTWAMCAPLWGNAFDAAIRGRS
jgi:glycosyltransferase involved in cell wall biosynthesis